jgi:hypothetical protein
MLRAQWTNLSTLRGFASAGSNLSNLFLSVDICLYLATPQGVLLGQPIYLGSLPKKKMGRSVHPVDQ